jgi:hypothetical protein
MTGADSDKPFKVTEHRRERRRVRSVLNVSYDDADSRLHRAPMFGDPWRAPKDGKQYWADRQHEAIRK